MLEKINSNFLDFGINPGQRNVQFIEGLLQDTLTGNQTVALAHIDVDWYDSVYTCVSRIFPRLAIGGVLIIDDYYDWGGCQRAVDDFLTTAKGQVCVDITGGSFKITRISA